MTCRLLTYNIKKGGRGRVDALAAVVNACRPDLVLLQEATDRNVVSELATLTGMAAHGTSPRQSLAYMSREPVAVARWIRPRFSRHAFIEIEPTRGGIRLFGVHLSAVLAAVTEQRRLFELRALLRSIRAHQSGFHLLVGDFNTLSPGDRLDVGRMPFRLRPFVWMSGGRIRWRTIQRVLDMGYVDSFRLKHPDEPGLTLPTGNPQVRLDYVFVPAAYADRVEACDVVRNPETLRASDHHPVVADVSI